jgi:PAS domain S-box-containing protein
MPESISFRTASGPMPGLDPQDVLMKSPIGIIFTSIPDGRFIWANPAQARMLGYESPKELIESVTDIASLVYADPGDRKEFMRQMEEHGEVFNHECRLQRKDGSELWVSRNVHAIRGEDRQIVAYQGFITDITERKKAEEALRRCEERYRNIADVNAGIVWEMDANLTVTYVSGRVYEMLGYEPEEIIGRNPQFLIDPEDRERVSAIMARMVHQQEPERDIEYWCRHGDSRRVRILTNSIAFFTQDRSLLGFCGTHIDMTEVYWARRCQEVTLRLHEMINDSDNAISAVLCEACSEVTDSPMAFFGMLEPDESAMIAHVWSPETMAECRIADKPLRFPIETAGLWAQPIRRREPVICNDYSGAVLKQGLPEGHVPISRYLGVPIIQGNNVIAVAGVANRSSGYEEKHINRLRMITSSIADSLLLRRNEEALRESEFRAKAMLQAIPDMMFRFNSLGVFLDYKAEHSDLYAQDVPTIIGKHTRDILPPEFVDLLDEKTRNALETGSLQAFEYQLPIPGQDVRDYECRMISSAADEVTAIVRDITERKRHEQELSVALSEKEVLLREVHHRVKNNLAAIISLIDLQRRNRKDTFGEDNLTELSNRIRSMSLIHEKLYRADSLASIDFQDYTQTLITHLRTAFGSSGITCRVDAPGVTIPLDLASPCGLIVNELVTNALKYAFPDDIPRPGNTGCRILVRLRRDKDTYTLTVADNGIGWPPGFDWTKTQTLGMTLVHMLGQYQLGGQYVVDQDNGTSITLTFTNRK